jgi:DNA primase
VLLMLDGDEAGRHGAMSVAQALDARMSVSVTALEDGRQPDQLAPSDIHGLVAPDLERHEPLRTASSMMERAPMDDSDGDGGLR